MRAHCLQHVSFESPGSIVPLLKTAGAAISETLLREDAALPGIEDFDFLVVMGGPMSVHDEAAFAWLAPEKRLIRDAVEDERLVLGVCLGAQMLAHVLGAKVYPGGRKEVGWHDVSLTADGMGDPCMAKLSVARKNIAQVFQWHGDTFDLPQDAVRLASSEIYLNQAFRYSQGVYALQFHIEVTPEIVRKWLTHEQGIDRAVVDADSTRIYPVYRERAERFYRSFFEDSGEAD